jgi:hypothetical protein
MIASGIMDIAQQIQGALPSVEPSPNLPPPPHDPALWKPVWMEAGRVFEDGTILKTAQWALEWIGAMGTLPLPPRTPRGDVGYTPPQIPVPVGISTAHGYSNGHTANPGGTPINLTINVDARGSSVSMREVEAAVKKGAETAINEWSRQAGSYIDSKLSMRGGRGRY